jgi:hypothetical protein
MIDLDHRSSAKCSAAPNSAAGTAAGVAVRILQRLLQRLLAMTAAIWHNWHTGQPIMRSLTAYDH